MPIIYSLTKNTKKSLLYYGIPLLAGLAVTHRFVPPTPGPIAVASIFNADLGWDILFGILAGIPAMAIAGPYFCKYIGHMLHDGISDFADLDYENTYHTKILSS